MLCLLQALPREGAASWGLAGIAKGVVATPGPAPAVMALACAPVESQGAKEGMVYIGAWC